MDPQAERDVVDVAAVQLQSTENHGIHESGTGVGPREERRASLPTSLPTGPSSLPASVFSPPAVARRPSAVAVMQTAVSRAVATVSPARSEFYLTFGSLGVPMVVAFLLSAVTLFGMAFVLVFPTHVANGLMQTSDLDQGEFWLLTKPPRALVVLSTLMLAVFGCCYIALAYIMVFSRGRLLQKSTSQPMIKRNGASLVGDVEASPNRSRSQALQLLEAVICTIQQARSPPTTASRRVVSATQGHPPRRSTFMHELTSEHGVYHAYYNALFDLPKLAFQSAVLGTYLTEGFPLPLIYFYVSMVMVNWLISFFRFQRHAADRNLVITRLFYLFDLFFAVFAPIIVITYAYTHFVLDRDIFAIRVRTLSPGMFDRIARLFADPVQVDVFRYAFQHLQLTKTWYVAGKCCLNALVVYKWKKIIAYLVTQRLTTSSISPSQAIPLVPQSNCAESQLSKRPRDWRAILKRVVRVHGKRCHLIFGILVFLTSMAAIPTYVSVSITSSLDNCAAIPQCRVVSYRWITGERECPCIVFIDRDQSPKAFDAWIHAPDSTQSLRLAAKSGHLKTVQIINRAVEELPIELRNCVELEQLILAYTRTQSLPDWVGEFHDLHYLSEVCRNK